MTPIQIYLDEDVHPLIAHALRLRGWTALTTVEARRQGTSDLQQIEFAAENDYVLLSYNVTDFPRLHYEFIGAGNHHCGVIVATQENPGANARALLEILNIFSGQDLLDQLIYLNNWM